MSAIRLILSGMMALMLVGCAGSPAHNAMNGKGFVCTMDNCAQVHKTFAKMEKYDRESKEEWTSPKSAECTTDHALDAQLRALGGGHLRSGARCEEILLARQAAHSAYVASLSPPPKNGGVLPKNYKQLVYAWAEDGLTDPFTARYKFGEWYTGYIERVKPTPSTPVAILYVSINAKNKYGGYVGYTIYRCAIIPHAAVCYDSKPAGWKFDENRPLTSR